MSNGGSNSIVPLIGRILVSVIFIVSGLAKVANFSMMTGYMTAKHLPLPALALAIAAAVEILGGLAVLLGYQVRIAGWVLFLYLIPTTVIFHNFWAFSGAEQMDNQIHFFKNVAIMGGLLFLTAFGAGAYSIDNKRAAA
jgi:putative oxidoreductase